MKFRSRIVLIAIVVCAISLSAAATAQADTVTVTAPAPGNRVGPNSWTGYQFTTDGFTQSATLVPQCTLFATPNVSGPCSSFPQTAPVAGTYMFQVTAYDAADQPVSGSSIFTYDDVPPVVSIPTIGTTPDSTPALLYDVSSPEGYAAGDCGVNTSAVTPPAVATLCFGTGPTGGFYTPPAPLANGDYVYWVRVHDQAENQSLWEHASFTIAAPTVSAALQVAPVNGYIKTAQPVFSISSSDSGANTFRCKIDSGANTPCNGSTTFMPASPLSEGGHTFTFTARDSYSNDASVAIAFLVDTVPPSLTITAPVSGDVVSVNTPDVSYAVSGGTAECSFDGGSFFPCAAASVAPPLKNGVHTVTVRATDLAGNVTTESVSFTVADPDQVPQILGDKFKSTKYKVKKGKFSLKLGWAFTLPDGVDATEACKGTVTLKYTAKKGKTGATKSTKRVPLTASHGGCAVSYTFRLPRKLKGAKATVTADFGGSSQLKPFNLTAKIKKL